MSKPSLTLEEQIKDLRRRVRELEEWQDTVFNSPLYKRIWWWMQGYRWKMVGRWYGNDTHLLPHKVN